MTARCVKFKRGFNWLNREKERSVSYLLGASFQRFVDETKKFGRLQWNI